MERVYIENINDIIKLNNHKVDISDFVDYWQKQEFNIFEEALKFINQFGDFEIIIKQINQNIKYHIITDLNNCMINKIAIKAYSDFI